MNLKLAKNPNFIANIFNDNLKKSWQFGELEILLPNGKAWHYIGENNGMRANIKINDYKCFNRIIFGGDIGFFEAYQNGEWESDNLLQTLQTLSENIDAIQEKLFKNSLISRMNFFLHILNKNSKNGSKKNIHAHYDLGNNFYSQWLDESMTYSAAVFDENQDLAEAQNKKYAELARMVDLKSGQDVLEIGCGWGGFAQYAAGVIGANVTCLTISQAQHDFAIERMKKLGLSDKVKVLLMDYRDIEGKFDAIVSIEMFEAVGKEYWRTYLDKVKSSLKPNGKAGLQIITIRDDLFHHYAQNADFIQKYVFPGGMLPSIAKLDEYSAKSGLKMQLQRQFGLDYAKTLEHWAQNFEKAWHEGRIKGFDLGFKRLWLFYLHYCQAGFNTARTDVVHLTLENAAFLNGKN